MKSASGAFAVSVRDLRKSYRLVLVAAWGLAGFVLGLRLFRWS